MKRVRFTANIFARVPDDFEIDGTEFLSVLVQDFRVIQGSSGKMTDDAKFEPQMMVVETVELDKLEVHSDSEFGISPMDTPVKFDHIKYESPYELDIGKD